MSKARVTKKSIKERYGNIVEVPYCNLQHVLCYKMPFGYTTRVEGWAADIYYIDSDTVIATGYAPFGNIKPGYELCRQYEAKAEQIMALYPFNISYEDMSMKLEELAENFCKDAISAKRKTNRRA